MVFSGPRTFLCILLLLSSVASTPSQSPADKAATSTITGKVIVGGKGLQGVVVGLVINDQTHSNSRPTRFRAVTDEDGKYRITNVLPGTYDVTPASAAYVVTEGRKTLMIGKNETVENIDIALQQGGVITGKVSDADGNPVIEETVYVFPAGASQQLPYFRNIRTDDRGIYRAYGLPPGKYTVSAGSDATTSAGTRRAEGTYPRTFHPSAVDLAAATVIDVTEGGEATNIDITFGRPTRTYTARGRIIDGDTNQPLPKTSVGIQVFTKYGISASQNVAVSTKDGEFKLESLPSGKYAVYSEPPPGSDWQSEAVQFEVTDRDVEGLVIKTSRGASVSGVVILEGTDDAKVRASLLATRIVGQIAAGYLGRTEPSSTINPDGSFRITGLAAGRLVLQLQPRETLQIIRMERDGMIVRDMEIKEHEQITGLRVVVGHANGGISGVIRRPDGFELPPTGRLRVLVRRAEDVGPGPYLAPVDADSRGHFRVDRLVPGTYVIIVSIFMTAPPAQRPNIPPAHQTVVVTSGAVTDVEITLQMPKPSPQ
jgi:Carboxypeptidase regulatory-like domain